MSDFTKGIRRLFFTPETRVRVFFAALAFFICLTAQSAMAGTFTVTTNADNGAGSLRQAVLDANATADNDTIVFNIPAGSCPAGVCTITLNSEIVITNNGSLTIKGTGANRLMIDGGAGTNRVFAIGLGATAFMSGLTVKGGNGGGAFENGQGGGIHSRGNLT